MSAVSGCAAAGLPFEPFGRGTERLFAAISLCTPREEVEERDSREDLLESEAARAVPLDPDRFLLLYDRYYDRILNYLYRRTSDLDLAQDLTSRTFLQAFEHLRKAERRVQVRPWLYRIATNVHLSHARRWTVWLRRLETAGRDLLHGTAPGPDTHLIRLSEEERVRHHLAELAEVDRTPLLLRYYEELSFREIARILGCTETGARTRVFRALRRLEKRMGDGEGRE